MSLQLSQGCDCVGTGQLSLDLERERRFFSPLPCVGIICGPFSSTSLSYPRISPLFRLQRDCLSELDT